MEHILSAFTFLITYATKICNIWQKAFLIKIIWTKSVLYILLMTTLFLKLDYHFPKKVVYLLPWKLFKMTKCFVFHVKSYFCSWDIYIFVLIFGYIEKWLDKKAKINFKIYDVADCTTLVTILIVSNISRSKSKQTMTFGHCLLAFTSWDIGAYYCAFLRYWSILLCIFLD